MSDVAPTKLDHCLWCRRELPFPATIPYIAIRERAICFTCVKHLAWIVANQEAIHGEEIYAIHGEKISNERAKP